MEAFGGRGYHVVQPEEILPALKAANEGEGPALPAELVSKGPRLMDHSGKLN